MGYGDPEAAKKALFERGLLERGSDDRLKFTESGRAMFFGVHDKIYRE